MKIIKEKKYKEIEVCSCFIVNNRILNEETVVRKDRIRIYINSGNEDHHNLPHVHVDYCDLKNYCSISLIDNEILDCKNRDNKKLKIIMDLYKKYILEAKIIWNKSDNYIKFKTDINNNPTSELVNIKY